MKRIVLGYDDTESAKRALKRTCELAKPLEGYVVVVSVAPVLVPAGHGIGPSTQRIHPSCIARNCSTQRPCSMRT